MRARRVVWWSVLFAAGAVFVWAATGPVGEGDSSQGVAQTADPPESAPFGEQETERANALSGAICDLRRQGRYAEAVPSAEQYAESRAQVYGVDSEQAREAARLLAQVRRASELPAEAQTELAEIDRLGESLVHLDRLEFKTAIENCTRRIDVRTRLLSAEDDETAHDYMVRGYARWNWEGDLAAAERDFRKALEIRRRVFGEDHDFVARDLHDIACVLEQMGDYAGATANLRESLAVRRKVFSPTYRHIAESCTRLGRNLMQRGEYAEAEAFLREAVAVAHQALLGRDPDGREGWGDERRDMAAGTVRGLASLLEARGEDANAERLFREALVRYQGLVSDGIVQMGKLREKAADLQQQGKAAEAKQQVDKADSMWRRLYAQEERVSAAMGDIARVLQSQGKLDEARQKYEEALVACRAVPGAQETEAQLRNDLASLLQAKREYGTAELHYRTALALRREAHGQEHPRIASNLHDLACLKHAQGEFDEARALHDQALTMRKTLLGPDHPDVVQSQTDIGRWLYDQGRYEEAERTLLEAAKGFESARLRVSTSGLERSPFTATRSPLAMLAACQARNGHEAQAYEHLERGLARGLLDSLSERKLRPLTAEQHEKEESLLGRLGKLDEQILVLDQAIATDSRNPMGPTAYTAKESTGEIQRRDPTQIAASRPSEEDRRQRKELQERCIRKRDELKAQYARFKQEILRQYGVQAGDVYDLARIQRQLRPDEAMIGWVDLKAHGRAKDANGEHWVCVVRREGEPHWMRLPGGDRGTWSKEDDDLPEQVRALVSDRHSADRERSAKLTALYHQRLKPVEDYLKADSSEPPLRHVIVLPAGWMAGIPVETLAKEEYTVSYAPSGTMYAWLHEQRQSREAHQAQAGLLVLGDPVFGQQSKSDVRGNVFAQLPGTRAEVEAIAGLCETLTPPTQITRLLGPDASQRKLEELALSGQLGQFRFIHLATHARMDDRAPMRSALILCQDNPEDQLKRAQAGQDVYNGRLTTDQIVRSWKLNAELVTLSGCETGLGRAAGGEGYLGFSQALFVVGARSLLLSLWKVDDTATALLMIRFYGNLLKRDGVVSPTGQLLPPTRAKAEALREAQRWLKGLTLDQIRSLCGQYGLRLPGAAARGQPGPLEPVPASPPFEHPSYWSAFVLIGDPD